MDGNRLGADTPGFALVEGDAERFKLLAVMHFDRGEIDRLSGGGHAPDRGDFLIGVVLGICCEVVVCKIDCGFLCHIAAPFCRAEKEQTLWQYSFVFISATPFSAVVASPRKSAGFSFFVSSTPALRASAPEPPLRRKR